MHRDLIAEIDTDAIEHNVGLIRRHCGAHIRICAAIKANAYGHGVGVVAPALDRAGVDMAAVATIGEAIELRGLGWRRPILCVGPVFAAPSAAERAERIEAAVRYDLTVTIVDGYGARDLDEAAGRQRKHVRFHVKVDTGMGRMGIAPATALDLIPKVACLPNIELEGVYTHLATADQEDRSFARAQLSQFRQLVDALRGGGVSVPLCHAANSSAALFMPESRFDMVRPGLSLYGHLASQQAQAPLPLRAALRLVSHLVLTKRVPPGQAVGYGCTFRTQRESLLGVVPIGYNDGYLRVLSNRACMGVAGAYAPVVGLISMDQTVLDLTDLEAAGSAPRVGDEVIIIDEKPDRPNSVEALARMMDTVPYEVTCLLGNRVARIARGERAGVGQQQAPAEIAVRG
ncbi:MAG TPA: alanine racemase [Phycisphaerae bacterium]|nr:alanine racemase [Phycisphaerae bacterium]